jgi:lipoprotein LprG
VTTIRRPVLAAALLALALTLVGCGSSSPATTPKGESPAAALAKAKTTFDAAQSITLDLATTSRPQHGNAVLGAKGVLTHAPAFKGDVTVFLLGTQATVPVVAVGGVLYAKLPLTTSYAKINPKDYGAPDPAEFVNPQRGLSTLLTEMTDAKATGQQREGATVLTTYAGDVPGAKVVPIIPSANPDMSYRTTVGLDKDDRLLTLHVTGDFFGGQSVTYDVTLTYGGPVQISAP